MLCCSLRISGHFPAPSVNGGADRLWKVQFSELQRPRDLDLDLESGNTAHLHASFIDLYVHTKFHWNRTNVLWTDGRTYWQTDIFPSNVIRSTLRSRLPVDLKSYQRASESITMQLRRNYRKTWAHNTNEYRGIFCGNGIGASLLGDWSRHLTASECSYRPTAGTSTY